MSLAKFIGEHEDAVESDLRQYTGAGIEDLGTKTLSWKTANSIIKTLPINSALARELSPEISSWENTLKTNLLLADVIDLLQLLVYVVSKIGGGNVQKPKPIKRPGSKDNSKHIGKGAMKVNDLKEWLFKRR